MTVKKKIFLLAALFYILYIIFPLFSDLINIPKWLPSIAASAIMIILYPKAFTNKTFYWFWAYIFVLIMYLLFGRPLTIGIGSVADSFKILIESSYILPTVGIFCVLYYLNDPNLTKKLVVWSLGILFVSFIVEIPIMQQYESLRAAYKEEQRDLQPAVPGLPGYSLMHAYTLFLPVMCHLLKVQSGKWRLFVFVGLIVLCFVIYDTFVTTSLILMIGILMFTLFYSDKGNTSFLITFSILSFSLYILYENGAFVAIIDWIMPAFTDTPVQDKLSDFKDSMLQGHIKGGSITGRMDHHAISRNAFFENPLFGASTAGGHSALLDRLGGIGLFGTIPFVMILISFIQQMAKRYRTRMSKSFFWVGVIVSFVYLYNKGNWSSESWLMFLVLMPMGILAFDKGKSVKGLK